MAARLIAKATKFENHLVIIEPTPKYCHILNDRIFKKRLEGKGSRRLHRKQWQSFDLDKKSPVS
ncbi:hypothetical protein [Thiomicrorhabdus sediminis]|uniref:Uncharacterized protein n=1 Tax=Thiomicrorhabdus sediminis TaxID=2580412 RepID=A0A4P9K5I3_9GAMM|nr:hypothetical protein [Thiomicrorhabdus sediminis]QCU89730.1 hypothetical protein FE785_03285 [Thiomicrorhabdus sediminis]